MQRTRPCQNRIRRSDRRPNSGKNHSVEFGSEINPKPPCIEGTPARRTFQLPDRQRTYTQNRGSEASGSSLRLAAAEAARVFFLSE